MQMRHLYFMLLAELLQFVNPILVPEVFSSDALRQKDQKESSKLYSMNLNLKLVPWGCLLKDLKFPKRGFDDWVGRGFLQQPLPQVYSGGGGLIPGTFEKNVEKARKI